MTRGSLASLFVGGAISAVALALASRVSWPARAGVDLVLVAGVTGLAVGVPFRDPRIAGAAAVTVAVGCLWAAGFVGLHDIDVEGTTSFRAWGPAAIAASMLLPLAGAARARARGGPDLVGPVTIGAGVAALLIAVANLPVVAVFGAASTVLSPWLVEVAAAGATRRGR